MAARNSRGSTQRGWPNGWKITASANSGRRTNWADALGANDFMARLLVHVEGKTEETFVNQILGPHLYKHRYEIVSARLLGNARQRDRRGGIRAWSAVR